jgi:hypothetical protein
LSKETLPRLKKNTSFPLSCPSLPPLVEGVEGGQDEGGPLWLVEVGLDDLDLQS